MWACIQRREDFANTYHLYKSFFGKQTMFAKIGQENSTLSTLLSRQMSTPPTITQLLRAWSAGDAAAADSLMPLVERELRRLAARHMRRERANHTLQTTALVNEAYLKLAKQDATDWQNRAHFFAIASRLMRRVLLDYARARQTQKREGIAVELSMGVEESSTSMSIETIIALDEVLGRLSEFDPLKCRIVEMRHFGGMSVEETSSILGLAPVTVMRHWRLAKAWMQKELGSPG
jgi:RNA polymerase sigma-70 factor (ECF subfamily)